MNSAEVYEAWRKRRADVEVNPRFADRVIDSLPPPGQTAGLAEPSPRGLVGVTSRYLAAAALLTASLVFGLLRIESVVALVLFLPSEGF